MKSKNPYTFFHSFCLRTPLLPLDFYHRLTKEKRITDEQFKAVWENDIIKEAVFLASPELFEAIEKWLGHQETDPKKIQRLQTALLKYLSRMASRCTPFGLFAGCSIGEFGNTTHIALAPYVQNSRQTRFDMNFLMAFSQKLSKQERLKKQLLWYPNTSLYTIGKQYRYIEYTYNEYNRRQYSIEAIHHSPYLEMVLKESGTGKKIAELVALLTPHAESEEDAETFVEALIQNQLLVSELEPSLTGADFLIQLKERLEKLTHTEETVEAIALFQQLMDQLDKQLGNTKAAYLHLSTAVKKLGTPLDIKYLFQTDMYTKTVANQLNTRWAYKIKRAMTLLNRISPKPQNTNLQQFKKAFTARYETREMPLSVALDTETGIGYLREQQAVDATPFLDDLEIPGRYNTYRDVSWNPVQDILYGKLRETIRNNEYTLYLEDEDFERLEANWDDLPDTMAAMVELVRLQGEEKVVLSSVGGASAANLLGRFSTGIPEMLTYVAHITDTERQMHPEALIAEIVHLPEARTGNILRRATLRDYEIPYLGKSSMPVAQQLPIDDLMISVKYDRLVLRSKKYNKEVLPRLSNAHNYSVNALPVYHFLCDMQRQGMRPGIGFYWGELQQKHTFLPRVVYKDVVLSKARWKITKKEMRALLKIDKETKPGSQDITSWRSKHRIPKVVQLMEGDNSLLIDLEHDNAVQMWLDAVKNKGSFVLEEFLFTEESIVKQGRTNYTNQCIISFYHEEKLKQLQRH
ncbi:MAG: lantibiotic dehydratase family protein [Bacteroidota bacterium]